MTGVDGPLTLPDRSINNVSVAPIAATEPRERLSAEERREQLISAATREFAELGYEGASTAAIARRAGISQPYIYALFPSKQELFIAVHDEVQRRIRDTFTDAAHEGSSPQERLVSMGQRYKPLIADRYALLIQLQMYACSDPVIRDHVAAGYRALFNDVVRLSGAEAHDVSLFFACGMLANVTTSLGLEDICEPLFNEDTSPVAHPQRG